ncbi:MAG: HAD-IA family hydrolase [Desulfobacteraceae bacterium]|nr:HAD-IA family hydrolase [Desulfobacteraceae bacterium]
MSALKLVIFDCDGVMFDSKEANRAYYNHLLARFGHPPMPEADVEYVHIHHVMDSVRHIFRHHPEDFPAADAYRREVDYTPYLRHMRMEPDLREFLELLRPDLNAAISTNRTTTMSTILKIFDLERYFDVVVTATDVARPKPHPDALRKILAQCRCAVDEAVYIGDSPVDQEHAAGVGMRFIAYKSPALVADHHVTSFMAITDLPFWPATAAQRQAAS